MAETTITLELGGGDLAELRDLKRMPRRVQLAAKHAGSVMAEKSPDEMVVNWAAFEHMLAWAVIGWTLDAPLPSVSPAVWDDMEADMANVFYQQCWFHIAWLNGIVAGHREAQNPDGYRDPFRRTGAGSK